MYQFQSCVRFRSALPKQHTLHARIELPEFLIVIQLLLEYATILRCTNRNSRHIFVPAHGVQSTVFVFVYRNDCDVHHRKCHMYSIQLDPTVEQLRSFLLEHFQHPSQLLQTIQY